MFWSILSGGLEYGESRYGQSHFFHRIPSAKGSGTGGGVWRLGETSALDEISRPTANRPLHRIRAFSFIIKTSNSNHCQDDIFSTRLVIPMRRSRVSIIRF